MSVWVLNIDEWGQQSPYSMAFFSRERNLSVIGA